MNVTLVCEGTVSEDTDGSPICSTGWEVVPHSVPFNVSDIDPSVVMTMFGAGFVLFVIPWAASWGVAQMLKLLK